MGRIPNELRAIIADNIRQCRLTKFPGRGGAKQCAEVFGVSPQQWSPWERGMRTPDEIRLQQLADFFGTTVELLRTDHRSAPLPEELDAAQNLGKIVEKLQLHAAISHQALCMINYHLSQAQRACANALSEVTGQEASLPCHSDK